MLKPPSSKAQIDKNLLFRCRHVLDATRVISFLMIAFGALVCAWVWSVPIEHFFHSRFALILVSVLFAFSGLALQPAIGAGFALGLREFAKATRQVTEEIRRAIHGDDDDGPNAT